MTSLQSSSLFRLALWALLLFADVAAAQEAGAEAMSAQIRSLLREGVSPHAGKFADYRKELNQLYQQNALLPLWLREGKPTPQAEAMLESFLAADEQGLNAADYAVEGLEKARRSPGLATDPREAAQFDVALSLSAMRYLSHLYLGRVNPRRVDFGFNIEAKKVDWPNLVQKIAQSGQPRALIAGMEPKLPAYRGLKEALARYRTLAKETPTPAFSFPAKFRPGAQHKDIPALRRLLLALGDMKAMPAENSETYDPALAEAVKSFQKRHGLGADAVIGPGTTAQLKVPLATRVKQIQLGMERLRWLPEETRGLVVNIPSFELYGSRGGNGFGEHELEMNVIVGRAAKGRYTPVFGADMTYVIFHPYWNVPDTIAARELVPAIRRNPGYLARNNLEIVSAYGNKKGAQAADASTLNQLASGALKLRQRPGPRNALGLVKFAFPNNNAVYLHSTPSKGLFQRSRRDFSHGCIRVQDPVRLAEWVLAKQGEWTRPRIESAMAAPSPKTVILKEPIPVYIFYSTALADGDGRVSFYDDIYGHDQTLQSLLAKGI